MKTKWKFVKKTDGTKAVEYYVSNTGLIKCIYTKSGKVKVYSGAKLAKGYNGKYYRYCSIGKVHRLVAKSFIPNPENLPEVDHIDGNPENNNVKNLRWCTHKQNMNNPITHCRRHGQLVTKTRTVIAWHQLDKDNNLVKEWDSLVDAAKVLGGTRQQLWNASRTGGLSLGFYWKKILKQAMYKIHEKVYNV